jgi:hypothetical protein
MKLPRKRQMIVVAALAAVGVLAGGWWLGQRIDRQLVGSWGSASQETATPFRFHPDGTGETGAPFPATRFRWWVEDGQLVRHVSLASTQFGDYRERIVSCLFQQQPLHGLLIQNEIVELTDSTMMLRDGYGVIQEYRRVEN